MPVDLSRSRVLVTGGHGFLGRRVVARLNGRGCREVIAPRHAECDLVDRAATVRLLRETRPDLVIHLAAVVGGIGANQAYPASYFFDNLMMGVQLLHESWSAGVAKFVAVGTVCAYPKHTPVPFREDDLWNGYPEETNAPDGLAKKMLLVQSQAYRQQYGFNAIYLLPTNLYGPGDNFDLETSHVLPAMIRRFHEAKVGARPEVVLWGSGSPRREFLHVDDLARAVVYLLEHYDDPDPINVGVGADVTIRELAELVARVVGFQGELRWDTTQPDGTPRKLLDVSRINKLGWRAEIGLEQGIRSTYQWYVNSLAAAPAAGS